MSADLIVSYDASDNDEDALALGAQLAAGGARLALAYVRHTREWDAEREQIAQHDAEHLLQQGARALAADVARHVVFHPSTPAGLQELAREQGARLIVFGSEYRTSPGRAEPGTSAQQLLNSGAVAIAVAAAGLRASRRAALQTISLVADDQDEAAQRTASELSRRLGAELVAPGRTADLIVVGSGPDGAPGAISLGGRARAALNAARGSVLVVPRGAPVTL